MKPAILTQYIPGRGCDATLELLAREWEGVFLSVGPSWECLHQKGLPAINLHDFYTDAMREAALQRIEKRKQAVLPRLREASDEACEKHWPPALAEALYDALVASCTDDDFFMQQEMAYRSMRAAMDNYDLRLVFLGDTFYPSNRLYALAARQYGIPSLELVHGVPGFNYSPQGRVCASDYVAAYSTFIRDQYVRFGMAGERIFVTGNPAWDHHGDISSLVQRRADCASLGLDPARPIIAFGMSWTYDSLYLRVTEAVLEQFLDLSRRHPHWQFVLRPHPMSFANQINPEVVLSLCKRFQQAGLHALALEMLPIERSLAMCDVMICGPSGLVNDSILAGKPLIVEWFHALRASRFEEPLDKLYGDTDAFLLARAPEALAGLVEEALHHPDTQARMAAARRRAAAHFNCAADSHAARRVVALIKIIMQARQPGPNGTAPAPPPGRINEDIAQAFEAIAADDAPQHAHLAGPALSPLDEVYEELCQFTALPPDEVRRRMLEQVMRTARLFNEGHDEGESAWYQTTDAYLFELANWEEDPLRATLADALQKGSGGRAWEVLEFGCGIGTFALELAKRGMHVWACDINQQNRAFLDYRVRRRGWNDRIEIITPEEALTRIRGYHIISAQHVLEHVPCPQETLQKMAACLKPGGIFLGIAPFNLVGPLFPEHNPENAHLRLEDLCQNAGLAVQDCVPFGNYQEHPFFLVQAVKQDP